MKRKIRPIKPDEIVKEKETNFPDAVFESFNELICRKFYGSSATILQDDVVALMVQKGLVREEIYDKGWLDIENFYEAAGWIVTYDSPGYNESYPSSFTFRRRTKGI